MQIFFYVRWIASKNNVKLQYLNFIAANLIVILLMKDITFKKMNQLCISLIASYLIELIEEN